MIWRSSSHQRLAQSADYITVVISFIATHFISAILHDIKFGIFPPIMEIHKADFLIVLIVSFIYIILFSEYGAYNYQRFTSLLKEYLIILKVAFIGSLINLTIIFLYGIKDLPRTFIIVFFVVSILLFMVEKTFMFYVAAHFRKRGKNRKRIVVIGTGLRTKHFIETVRNHFSWGLDIIGLISDSGVITGEQLFEVKIIGCYNEMEKILKTYNPEEVIVTVSTERFEIIKEIFETCEKVGVNVKINSDFFGHFTKYVTSDNIFGLNIISFYPSKLSELDLIIKRFIDIILSITGIILLSPLLLIITLLIYFQDGSPILYPWKVVGFQRKPIDSWKFRTMVHNADELKKQLIEKNEMTGPMFKLTDDPRILKIGKFLRKYSLDELPQLFSVLKGDLSLVGPRPPLQTEFREFDLWHRRKLSVKPGLTCLWQINGRNKIANFDEWAKLDLDYIDNWSLALDFKILLKTIPVVLSGRGAK